MPYTLPPSSRHSYLTLGKRTLLGLAAVMAISIVFISNYNSGEKSGRVVLSGAEKKGKSAAIMENPRYFGVDKENRPFTVTASKAVQTDEHIITLTSVQADMLLDAAKWLAVSADGGRIKSQGEEIELFTNVNMFYEGGYEFRSNYAMIRPNKGYASGNQPIEGQGPSGTLLADQFEVLDHGERMIFRDNVKTTVYLD